MPRLGPILLVALLTLQPAVAAAIETSLTVAGDQALDGPLRASSRALSAIDSVADSDPDAPAPPTAEDIVALAGADYGRLLSTLYAQGYFAPEISIRVNGREVADLSPFSRIDRVDTLSYEIRPGPAFRFATVSIGPLAPGDSLPESVAPGEPARISALEGAVIGALDGWRAQAHAKPRVVGETVTADNRAATLSASYAIAPGATATFGQVAVAGTTSVREDRIRQIAGIQSGKPFDPDALAEAQRRLRAAGAFSAATITEADAIGTNGAVDLTINVSEAKPRRIGVGGEYSTTDGLTLSAFWLHRNMRNAAERLRFDGIIEGIGNDNGGINYRLIARYTRPATFTEDTDPSIAIGAESLDEDTYRSDRAFFEFGVDRYIDETLDASLFLNYSYSDVKDAFGHRHFNILALRGRLRYDTRDNPGAATRGLYAEGRLEPFYSVGEGVTGLRTLFDGRAYRAVGERLVLAGRAQLGSIAGAELDEVPPEYLFYAGGGGSIRGFGYQSINVPLPDDKATGGRSLAVFSAEARFRITDAIGAVGFFDTGAIGSDSWIGSDDSWYSGAGLGARYATPIGPIRFDVATPVQGGETGDIEIYIGIGESF